MLMFLRGICFTISPTSFIYLSLIYRNNNKRHICFGNAVQRVLFLDYEDSKFLFLMNLLQKEVNTAEHKTETTGNAVMHLLLRCL